MEYPQNKKKALELEDIGAKWGIEKELGRGIIHYFNDLGAKHELPSEPRDLVDYVNRFHRKMTVGNIHWPEDIHFDVIYTSFCTAMLNGMIRLPEYQPHATKNQIDAFRKWITSGNVLENLYERFYNYYPSKRPKQISEPSTKLSDWTDDMIKKQYETICRIFQNDKGKIPIFQSSGAKSYFNHIKTEYLKRFADGDDLAKTLYT